MDFDWTTFILEIINFLILIWILKRFLYQPVLDIIDKRRAGIDQAMNEAQRLEEEAKALKQQNEQFLVEWENQKEIAHAQLSTELAEIRERKLSELTQRIEEETERRKILGERRQLEYEQKVEEKAIEKGTAFVGTLLSRMATPELEAQLFQLLLEDLDGLNEKNRRAIAEATVSLTSPILVQSAFPLSRAQCEALSSALAGIIGHKPELVFHCNDMLLAGIYIEIGPWILHANLRDELKFFSKPVQHDH